MFLAALAQEHSDDRKAEAYRRIALGACSDLLGLLNARDTRDEQRWWRDQTLGLAGCGGELLALVLLRDLLPEFEHPVASGLPALLEALDLRLLREDERLDVIFGCAGLIGPLLKIGTPLAVALALEAGDRLVDRQDDGGGWVLPSIGPKGAYGFLPWRVRDGGRAGARTRRGDRARRLPQGSR